MTRVGEGLRPWEGTPLSTQALSGDTASVLRSNDQALDRRYPGGAVHNIAGLHSSKIPRQTENQGERSPELKEMKETPGVCRA